MKKQALPGGTLGSALFVFLVMSGGVQRHWQPGLNPLSQTRMRQRHPSLTPMRSR
jgi:hypothetical protein